MCRLWYRFQAEGALPDFIFEGRTALCAAAEGGHLTSVNTLCRAGANYRIVNSNTGLPPIVAAAGEGYTEIVKYLLDQGEKADHVAPVRMHYHHLLVVVGSSCCASGWLWTQVFNVKFKFKLRPDELFLCGDLDGQTGGKSALMFAAMRGYVDTVKLLLARGADPNRRDDVRCQNLMSTITAPCESLRPL